MNSENKQYLPLLILAAMVAGMVNAPYFMQRHEHAVLCASGRTDLNPIWVEKNCK